jgi:hypothetical protein
MKEKVCRRGFLKLAGGASVAPFLSSFRRKTEFLAVENETLVLNERVESILSQVTPLSFDEQGNLMLGEYESITENCVVSMPTQRSMEYQRTNNKVKDVKLLVVHFDGASRYRNSGKTRNARNTLYGLDGNNASVHWCVDEFQIDPDGNDDIGYGILQTQPASGDPNKPYKGKHVTIGVELATGRPDLNRIYTGNLSKKLGLRSNLNDLIEAGITDIDNYSVGFEQIGWYYSRNFPNNFPPEKQISNVLSLTLAVIEQFGLSPWDIVGHNEIQEKPDPGNEFMATLRFLVGVYLLKQRRYKPLTSSEFKVFKNYFIDIGKYLKEKSGQHRFNRWNEYIGFDKFIAGLFYRNQNYMLRKLMEIEF